MTAVLEVRHVAAAYGDVQALWDVSFAVDPGQTATLLGSNGAGKTTTLRVISGLIAALEGEVLLHGERISGLSPHRIVELGVIQVPEGRHLWPNMSVEDNLLLGAYSRRSRGDRAATLRSVYKLFPRLAERRAQMAGTLSGGEQQMLSMSRALATEPALLLLDELSMGLAPLIVEELYELVAGFAREGLSILIVEQFAQAVLGVSTIASIMLHGRITRTGPPAEIAEELTAAYLGTSTNPSH
jgi:branched-chain amino acid transport system ATP-binding protein